MLVGKAKILGLLDAPRWSPLNVVQVDGCAGEMVCTHQLRYPPSRVARFVKYHLLSRGNAQNGAHEGLDTRDRARGCGQDIFRRR